MQLVIPEGTSEETAVKMVQKAWEEVIELTSNSDRTYVVNDFSQEEPPEDGV